MDKYYKILGATENMSDLELTQLYRKLIMEYHPNYNQEIGTNEKIIEITNAFSHIMNMRKNGTSFEDYNPITGIEKNLEKQKSLRQEIATYLQNHYHEIPKTNSYGRFIYASKLFNNEEIKCDDLHFVDGYTQIDLGKCYTPEFEHGFFGPTHKYFYNYVDKDGNFLFDSDMCLLTYYIGRGLFLNQTEDFEWSVVNTKGKYKFLSDFKGFTCIYDREKFILNVVNELNRKYEMEANGKRYKIAKNGICYPHWRQDGKGQFLNTNIKKAVRGVVDRISDFDTYTREMYVGQTMYDERKYLKDSKNKQYKISK